ncbi:MAG: magnesium-translocating P-type ATPase [Erysipelotrichaceae bacterium]|nr:magnesium-translocating P-type ATPase [Erysipelotrichaceae bacterium]
MKNLTIHANPAACFDKASQEQYKLAAAVSCSRDDVLKLYGSSPQGLSQSQAEESRNRFGSNVVTHGNENAVIKRIAGAFVNPFTAILTVLAGVSVFTDIILASPEDRNFATVTIIAVMVLVSGFLRLIQETRSSNAAEKLQKMICTTACVERVETGKKEIPLDEIVVGDLIHLSAGDLIPADVRILSAKDLFVSQAALTGESEPVEKTGQPCDPCQSAAEIENLAFMGSTVISGTAKAIAVRTGNHTLFGSMAKTLDQKPPQTGFEKGINAVSWVLIRFMLVMVPIVLYINGLTKGDWMGALLFSISVAVGLTPEMLPMIVTANLAKGAVAMSRKKVIIKNLHAIQNLGSIDILCTDKTGTLTQDKVVLQYCLDIHGKEDSRVLRHAYLNSRFQTGLKNLIDLAVIERQEAAGAAEIQEKYTKVDEIPFDFSRRRMSVVVADKAGKTQLVTKGAVEEMLKCCSWAEYEGKVTPLTEDIRCFVLNAAGRLNAKGMRVLAVAHKTNPRPVSQFCAADESEMVLIGFLALLDPPKPTAAAAIQGLNEYGVAVKILTGDNDKVTASIAAQVGLEVREVLLGSDIETMTDSVLAEKAEKTAVFAKLSPEQKARVIRILRSNGHSVAYMGDGINDAAAMKVSDAGISVDSAVDIARESADVILLEKDLTVLKEGVIEGRRIYANMIKYIKMTASSNFGNMFSVLAASAFLPFLPMQALHLIFLNLIYDLSCMAIPWDHVDREYLKKPRNWDASSVGRFMLWIGPVSSIFDIATYLLMFFVICPAVCGGQFQTLTDPSKTALFVSLFQAGWFVESMWSQTLVIHMIRTPKIPFIQSRASLPVTLLTFAGIGIVTLIPFTALGTVLGFAGLPLIYFFWLALIVLSYMTLTTLVKNIYVKKYRELL